MFYRRAYPWAFFCVKWHDPRLESVMSYRKFNSDNRCITWRTILPKFHPDAIWNNEASGFWGASSQQEQQQQQQVTIWVAIWDRFLIQKVWMNNQSMHTFYKCIFYYSWTSVYILKSTWHRMSCHINHSQIFHRETRSGCWRWMWSFAACYNFE